MYTHALSNIYQNCVEVFQTSFQNPLKIVPKSIEMRCPRASQTRSDTERQMPPSSAWAYGSEGQNPSKRCNCHPKSRFRGCRKKLEKVEKKRPHSRDFLDQVTGLETLLELLNRPTNRPTNQPTNQPTEARWRVGPKATGYSFVALVALLWW